MVNTLRITSVVAVLIAVVLLFLVAGPKSVVPKLLAKFAMGSDDEVERILSAPTVVDRFKENQGDRNRSPQDATSPLVKQAEIFANIITPRPHVAGSRETTSGGARKPGPVVKPVASSAKFDLVGTTYLPAEPEFSFAYIRLPDDTYQWLRRGDEVGHLTVKEIKSGSIICWDGHKDVEMATESMPETANLLEPGGGSAIRTEVDKMPVQPASGRITGPPVPRPWMSNRGAAAPATKIDAEEREKMAELVSRIRESSGVASGTSPEERAAMMKKLMSEFKASRISAEEAEDVEDLGRELNESQTAPPSEKRTNLRRKLNIPRSIKK